jgi:predicted amidophosphoribosyltransferase
MSRKERIDNQKNAFSINSSVENKIIILIDDVTTTGSTLHEARTLLLKKGAHEVHALTIAH